MKQQKITDVLTFLKRSKELQSIERYNTSLSGKQNSVAEHSWRLALMVLVIGTDSNANLDIGRALSLALIHDLAEAKTGDIGAYVQIQGGKELVKEKAEKEIAAMREITDDLSFGDWIFSLWREFEDGTTVESKFVRALDKIEGYLHIAEGEVKAYLPKEFHADYANKAVAAFDEATNNFPGLTDLLDSVKADLKAQFEKTGVTWIES